ncbi:uncharacterized protein [Nicotiana tomentosiformis]|uniref:uncharacterized protein n=1 Tax=Nicotiana tomentosiformis TaxID=4098 RepID=UPI00388C3464
MTCMRNSCPDLKKLSNLEIMNQEVEYDEDEAFREMKRQLDQFENKPKPNLNETEAINLGSPEETRETKISIHTEQKTRDAIIQVLFEYRDVFAWSYDDMPGLSADLVVHKLPTHSNFAPIQQKQRKFKTDMSDKIKEEITKQLSANVIRVVRYTTWLANVVPVPKKDGKIRVCVDYRDLNKASPKDNFPLPNIHILVDNCAKHEIQSFVDCYAGYHQILMDKEDAEKTAFTTPWGTYCYRVMPFGLKNAGATYMRAMTTIFHDMMHKEIEVYVDDVIIKSRTQAYHVQDLKRFFERLRRYNLKLNPAKCAFGVPSGKLLGFIVSRRGIELDPSKIKTIRELPPPKNKTEVMSLLGRLNYISRFISQLTTTCEPIFKLLKKNAAINWTDECQEAFDKIKEYLSNPPVLVPPEPDRPLFLYLSSIEFRYIPRFHNELADALATLASMLPYSGNTHIDPLEIQIRDQHEYPEHANRDQKRTIRRLSNGFFLSGEILYKRTLDLNLLRCVDAKEAEMIMNEVHSGVCGPHMNGYVLAKKILRAGYCEQFKIEHRNSTPYRPKANGAVEAANKNIKKILRKMIQGSRQWHEKLPFALLGYRTTVRTSVGATPYLLVYGTEAVIPAEIEIPSLRIIVEAGIEDTEWVKSRLEQLNLIDEKRLAAVCFGQLYQQRMARAYNKKVRPRKFEVGQLVLKRIFPHQEEAKGKFAPNWQGPYLVKKVLSKGALHLVDIEGKVTDISVNADAVKRYYV